MNGIFILTFLQEEEETPDPHSDAKKLEVSSTHFIFIFQNLSFCLSNLRTAFHIYPLLDTKRVWKLKINGGVFGNA